MTPERILTAEDIRALIRHPSHNPRIRFMPPYYFAVHNGSGRRITLDAVVVSGPRGEITYRNTPRTRITGIFINEDRRTATIVELDQDRYSAFSSYRYDKSSLDFRFKPLP